MIHVDDLVRGILQSASHPGGIGTFFLTDGRPHPWSEIAGALAVAARRRVRTGTVPDAVVHLAGALNEAAHRLRGRSALFDRAKARDFTATGWVCSSEAASRAFAYSPRVDLTEGMTSTMDWYRTEGWL
jgi:nucleoside-diphosphate-sugar epimerase